jgi:hypothetical protein
MQATLGSPTVTLVSVREKTGEDSCHVRKQSSCGFGSASRKPCAVTQRFGV